MRQTGQGTGKIEFFRPDAVTGDQPAAGLEGRQQPHQRPGHPKGRLGGRCRDCRGPITARYPLVEATAGLLTWLFIQRDGFTPLLGFHLVFVYVGLALALIDLDTFLLPFVLTLPLIPISIASGFFDPHRGWIQALIGAGVGWALIVLIGKVGELATGKEAMGGGDAWLMASIGILCVLATGATILFAPHDALTYDNFAAAIGAPMAVVLPIVGTLSVPPSGASGPA